MGVSLFSFGGLFMYGVFFRPEFIGPNSEVLPKSLASRLSALNILPSDILELAGKREITDEM